MPRKTEGVPAAEAPRVLIVTSLTPGKDYCREFLFSAVLQLQGAAHLHVILDGGEVGDLGEGEKSDILTWELLPDPEEGCAWASEPSARCGRVREAARQFFLQGDWTHLYFHDADMIPPQSLLANLLALESDAVSALYCKRGLPHAEIPVRLLGSAAPRFLPGGGPVYAVEGFGMGACLLSRRVLAAVPFRTPEELHPVALGEDYAWGEDAQAAGFTLVLDPSAVCWHVGEDSTAYRPTLGEVQPGALWTDTPHEVRNASGLWRQGEPRFDLSPAQRDTLGPGFHVGLLTELGLETARVEEVL